MVVVGGGARVERERERKREERNGRENKGIVVSFVVSVLYVCLNNYFLSY